jgi:hypothetical protein
MFFQSISLSSVTVILEGRPLLVDEVIRQILKKLKRGAELDASADVGQIGRCPHMTMVSQF